MISETERLQSLNEPTFDFFILADRAEAVNGKLYMMGGGWTRTIVPDVSQPAPLSFAVGVLVPWNATNQQHTVRITIEDLDRHRPVEFELEAGFVTGRPATATVAETQRALLALPAVPVLYPGPGAYQTASSPGRFFTGEQDARLADSPAREPNGEPKSLSKDPAQSVAGAPTRCYR